MSGAVLIKTFPCHLFDVVIQFTYQFLNSVSDEAELKPVQMVIFDIKMIGGY